VAAIYIISYVLRFRDSGFSGSMIFVECSVDRRLWIMVVDSGLTTVVDSERLEWSVLADWSSP
jgi:hypothetical protein